MGNQFLSKNLEKSNTNLLKLMAKIIYFLALSIYAQDSDLSDEVGSKRFRSIKAMVNGMVTSNKSDIMKYLTSYGCHCYPDRSKAVGGNGSPVDALDAACRDLYRCKRCIEMDGGECDVDFGTYHFRIENGRVDCSRNADCELNQCLCDAKFAKEVSDLWSDNDFNTHYWLNPKNMRKQQNNGTPVFDADSVCIAPGPGYAPNACCGDYPNRRIYSSTVMDCCDDGSLASVGSC